MFYKLLINYVIRIHYIFLGRKRFIHEDKIIDLHKKVNGITLLVIFLKCLKLKINLMFSASPYKKK